MSSLSVDMRNTLCLMSNVQYEEALLQLQWTSLPHVYIHCMFIIITVTDYQGYCIYCKYHKSQPRKWDLASMYH